MIIKEHYKQLYAKTGDKLDEMDKFLPNYQNLKRNNLNKPTTSKEIELVIKTYPRRKVQAQIFSLVFSTKHLKKLHQFFKPFSKI